MYFKCILYHSACNIIYILPLLNYLFVMNHENNVLYDSSLEILPINLKKLNPLIVESLVGSFKLYTQIVFIYTASFCINGNKSRSQLNEVEK